MSEDSGIKQWLHSSIKFLVKMKKCVFFFFKLKNWRSFLANPVFIICKPKLYSLKLFFFFDISIEIPENKLVTLWKQNVPAIFFSPQDWLYLSYKVPMQLYLDYLLILCIVNIARYICLVLDLSDYVLRWLNCSNLNFIRTTQWTPGVGDRQGGLACCDSWGRKESDTTERLNWTELIGYSSVNLRIDVLTVWWKENIHVPFILGSRKYRMVRLWLRLLGLLPNLMFFRCFSKATGVILS